MTPNNKTITAESITIGGLTLSKEMVDLIKRLTDYHDFNSESYLKIIDDAISLIIRVSYNLDSNDHEEAAEHLLAIRELTALKEVFEPFKVANKR